MESKNIGNVAGGYKAAMKNPNVSEQGKEHSQQALESMEERGDLQQPESEAGKNPGNIAGGHKAALKNPRVSEEAKEHSRSVLEEHEQI